ncbi:MAG: RsmB/NOP family class I SAM-dependent RNA methyltransferase, partial [Lachnospiraceae bacterium]|nr:RsmB/NOP family class I SAM-dependent RNA methyltransferase [Lachnospiraceae bacterium]
MSYKQLPSEYLERMKASLTDDFEAFLRTYDEEPVKGLRFNPRRARPETVEKLVREWSLEPVPWCKDGYYYQENADDTEANPDSDITGNGDTVANVPGAENNGATGGSRVIRPGLSPYHDAGVFYIQEPSAMITASSADIRETDVVLDLCAAPGGKSTQAAALAGLLVSNEPIANRARILSSNIERMGFANTVVTSAWPDELARVCGAMFDRIIVDAPCSGEGMMRKDETAVEEWSPANVALCIERQAEILEAADEMLKTGGKLTYSTCTFEYGENEGQIRHFLEAHPDYTLLDMHLLYPHEIRGEGHFCAVLLKRAPGAPESDVAYEPYD